MRADLTNDSKRLAQRLADWYRANRRDLPWRDTDDPWAVVVSEFMLQQTQVATALPYYERFMARFPTPADLAAAEEGEVQRLWAGLGYYSRARNLQATARRVVDAHGGRFPSDPAALAELPGFGPYTVGAVASIAFGRPVPAVDGNVLRVVSRLQAIGEEPRQPAVRRTIEAFVRELLASGPPPVLTQALMELGALVCLPSAPRCGDCPVASGCAARARGLERALPVRRKGAKPVAVDLAVALVADRRGRLLAVRRPETGLLAGQWEFPQVEGAGADARARLAERLGVAPAAIRPTGIRTKHVFSHRVWRLTAFTAVRAAPGRARTGSAWVAPGEFSELPLCTPHRRLHEAVVKEGTRS